MIAFVTAFSTPPAAETWAPTFQGLLTRSRKQRGIQLLCFFLPSAFGLSRSFNCVRGFGIFDCGAVDVSSENRGRASPKVDLPRITNELDSTWGGQISTVVAEVGSNFIFFAGGWEEPDKSSCAWVMADRVWRVTTITPVDGIFVLRIWRYPENKGRVARDIHVHVGRKETGWAGPQDRLTTYVMTKSLTAIDAEGRITYLQTYILVTRSIVLVEPVGRV